jgi:eukaryotic-like serine/threonine-protein kinase
LSLIAGTRLGPYEVISALGAGGMGEVYRARDTRIDRTVAIKVLPADATRDLGAEGRFEREARALAALNHPRICTLFEFTRLDGKALLIMEHLEGQSLSDRLARGRLPLDEALRVGAEIADGLAVAHRAGLVHRDLKPANVMLTRTGAKLLDFGLAKTAVAETRADEPTEQALTHAGVVLGTVPFMAPEQLDGHQADQRSDVWAFGCVLYEMLTGRRAFAGATPAAVAAAILERDPPAPSAIEPTMPGALDRVVRKCLSRDPDARWQSAADLRDELQWIAGGGERGMPLPAPQPPPRAWRDRWLGAAAVAAIALAAVLAWRPWRAPAPEAPARQLELTIPRIAAIESLALSPDGSMLAFIAGGSKGTQSLWVRSLASGAVRPIVGTEGAVPGAPPFWSPDGDNIAFVASRKLRRVSLTSGQVQTIADVQGQILGGDWGADGTILVGTYQLSKTRGIHRVPASGGQLAPVTTIEPEVLLHATPRFLPDGRRFLFLEWAFDERRRDVCAASLESPAPRCFNVRSHFFAGLTDRYVLYSRDARMFAHPFDVDSATLSGEPVVLAERLAEDRLAKIGVSVAGHETLVYQPAAHKVRQLVWLDRSGARVGVMGTPAVQDRFDVDAGGHRAAVERMGEDGMQLWLIDVDRDLATRADVGSDPVSAPVLSRDGQRLAYIAREQERTAVIERPTQGGAGRVVFEYRGEGVVYLAGRSWDGKSLLVSVADRKGRTVQIVPTDGGQPTVVGGTWLSPSTARVSPDGRWLAFASTQSGQPQVFVAPIPATGEQWQISAGGGEHPQWRGDGGELFFITPDGSMMAAPIAPGPTFDFTAPRALFNTGLTGDLSSQRFVATADGKRFLFSMLPEGDHAATTTMLQVVLNWTKGLPR